MARNLEELTHYLDSLHDRPPLAELAAELDELEIEVEDLAPFVRFSDRSYARNLVRSGEWYYLLVLCWKNGQRSPIHDHGESVCGLRVLRGTMTETRFEFAPNGHVKATFSRDCGPGTVAATQDDDLHQVSNLQAGKADLVTLHIYSPPLLSMRTFSLIDGTQGEEPMFLEFSEAAGI